MIKFNDSAARPAAAAKAPSVLLSSIPIIFLLLAIVCVIVFFGADRVSEFGPWALLAAASVAVVSGVCSRTLRKRNQTKYPTDFAGCSAACFHCHSFGYVDAFGRGAYSY